MKSGALFTFVSLLFAAACIAVIFGCKINRENDDIFTAKITSAASYENSPKEKININKASAEELTSLPGIGDVIAESIVKYREEYGGFESVEELTEVDGIGVGRLENIKEMITL